MPMAPGLGATVVGAGFARAAVGMVAVTVEIAGAMTGGAIVTVEIGDGIVIALVGAGEDARAPSGVVLLPPERALAVAPACD